MSEVKTLKEIALELLEKYRLTETSLIWRMSGLISEDITELESECNYIRKQIEGIAEPKKGKWRHYEGMLTCLECGAEFYDDIMEYTGDEVPHFCPNCGAKMEAKE